MANQKNDLPVLFSTLVITIGLLGVGIWFVTDKLSLGLNSASRSPSPSPSVPSPGSPTANSAAAPAQLSLDTSKPDPAILAMDGSVSLVALIKRLQTAYLQLNPDLPTAYGVPNGKPNGTNVGIRNLIDGKVSLAVSSRPLKLEEVQLGLQAVPIVRDALAIAVSVDNPYKDGLTLDQLKQIFQGKITNWSQVGGPDRPIRVINRSMNSGTHTFFQEVVLLGEPFAADSKTFTTAQQDETTPLLRALGVDGITYGTVTQLENQQTVRVVDIEGISPLDQNAVKTGTYPISRVGYLVVSQPTSPAAQEFITLARSPQGQEIMRRLGFTPID